jgi:hypothetical protein
LKHLNDEFDCASVYQLLSDEKDDETGDGFPLQEVTEDQSVVEDKAFGDTCVVANHLYQTETATEVCVEKTALKKKQKMMLMVVVEEDGDEGWVVWVAREMKLWADPGNNNFQTMDIPLRTFACGKTEMKLTRLKLRKQKIRNMYSCRCYCCWRGTTVVGAYAKAKTR